MRLSSDNIGNDNNKNSGKSLIDIKQRVIVFALLIISVFVIYMVYIFNLQIIKGIEYKKKAKELTRREIIIPAQRGEIYDRNYDIPLVENVESFALDVIPGDIADSNKIEIFKRLASVLDLDMSYIQRKIPAKYYHLFQPIEIKSGVSFKTVAYISEHIENFPGVSWRSKPKRKYRLGKSMAHILGYTGDITKEELQILYNEGYSPGTTIGKSGIERQYDKLLRGKDGRRYKIVDVKERRLLNEKVEETPPVPGNNIVLTVDRRIQELCEKALGPRIGSVIVLKPSTGEILAMVSYPRYDPNIFEGVESEKKYKELLLDPSSPFINRAIQSVYPPASTFKVIMTAAFLEEVQNAENRTFTCNGSLKYGDRVFHCWRKNGHGTLNLFQGLAQSCDVYFYNVGLELGVERIISYARDFGLGRLSGIDLPGEVTGFVPTPEWKEKVYHMKWLGGDTINLSIGQGYITLSPIQMADMVAMVVNEGVIYKPFMLKEIRDPVTGMLVKSTKKEILHSSHIKKETFEKLQRAMRGVITEGTAKVVITTKAVDVAGKTGTSETAVEERFHSWFAAYAPYITDNPDERVVVVVMVEAANEWEWWAPKAANIIFQGIFANQNFEDAVQTLHPWYIKDIRSID